MLSALKSFPELPPISNTATPLSLCNFISAPYPPVIYRYSSEHEDDHNDRLQWLCKYRSAQQEQTHAAKYNRRCNPSLVWPFQIRFLDSEDDKSKDSKEVKCVSSNSIEC